MIVSETALPGVLHIEPRRFGDPRGWFMEYWNAARFAEAGLEVGFVQDNLSFSRRGILRGLHYQHPYGQAKLVGVLQGEVWDVAVDIRVGSPTFGAWYGCTLSAERANQLFIPAGFAHGFLVLSETALFGYKCSELYHPEAEGTVRWDDPTLGIAWPADRPELSEKDAAAPVLADLPRDRLPPY